MELAPSGVPLSFEVTFPSSGLPVAMSVYDDSGSLPVLISGPLAMYNIPSTNTYRGKFTAEAEKSYIILKAVYTDGTFVSLDPDYSQGSESVVAQDLNPSAAFNGCELIGFVDDGCPTGFVPC